MSRVVDYLFWSPHREEEREAFLHFSNSTRPS